VGKEEHRIAKHTRKNKPCKAPCPAEGGSAAGASILCLLAVLMLVHQLSTDVRGFLPPRATGDAALVGKGGPHPRVRIEPVLKGLAPRGTPEYFRPSPTIRPLAAAEIREIPSNAQKTQTLQNLKDKNTAQCQTAMCGLR
jgi:hypothetical protein